MSEPDQREVLEAAELALSRVMAGVADEVERMPPDLEPADALRWAGDRVTELLAGFADLPLDRLLGLADTSTAGAAPDPDGRRGPPEATGQPLSVRVPAGSTVEVRVWVHLVAGDLAGRLRFDLGALVGPDGTAWTGSDVIFTPAACRLPITAPWSTVLRFGVPADAVPGSHHGLVIARGAIAAVVPITVVVT